jgi:hypothetical protein
MLFALCGFLRKAAQLATGDLIITRGPKPTQPDPLL